MIGIHYNRIYSVFNDHSEMYCIANLPAPSQRSPFYPLIDHAAVFDDAIESPHGCHAPLFGYNAAFPISTTKSIVYPILSPRRFTGIHRYNNRIVIM